MSEPEDHRVNDALCAINSALNVIVQLTMDQGKYPEVAAEERELWAVKSHVEFILSYIKSRKDAAPRAMQ
jgi:hypothetical protein